MSEKKPFDAAIGMLRGKGIRLFPPTEVQAAIRVLEAAGKVDKENALWNIDVAFSQGRGHVEMMAPYRADHNLKNYNRADKEITALLESLPDGGKK
jgi:hypothetical protein